jgi:hypothetical protein
MSTFGELAIIVARGLQDPSNKTFTTAMVGDLVAAGATEVGRLAPEHFQEDIAPVADQLEYTVRSSWFGDPVPEIEVARIEVWDGTTTPMTFLKRLAPGGEYENSSQGGWRMWGGVLSLPNATEAALDPDKHVIRLWGLSPYKVPTLAFFDVQPTGMSNEVEQAAVEYARYEGLKMLIASRELFAQWQTRSGNSDTTMAGLLNAFNVAQDAWRRKARALTVLRERP